MGNSLFLSFMYFTPTPTPQYRSFSEAMESLLDTQIPLLFNYLLSSNCTLNRVCQDAGCMYDSKLFALWLEITKVKNKHIPRLCFS